MNYIEYKFSIPSDITADVIIALIEDLPFDSFMENEEHLLAYINEKDITTDTENVLKEVFSGLNIAWEKQKIKHQNWNATWESNFHSVKVENDIFIRAPFHEAEKGFKWEIVISPKMSFGTGHHETTWLMSSLMREMKFKNKKVLDMGCGTGILAILAEKMGATEIIAVDHDPQCVENSQENIELNNCEKIICKEGTVNAIKDEGFDIILANINRNVLLGDIPEYEYKLNEGGKLLLSGFYTHDEDMLKECAEENQFSFIKSDSKNSWATMLFKK